jgi:hypothetical protein
VSIGEESALQRPLIGLDDVLDHLLDGRPVVHEYAPPSMRRVIIEGPYAGDVDRNTAYARGDARLPHPR